MNPTLFFVFILLFLNISLQISYGFPINVQDESSTQQSNATSSNENEKISTSGSSHSNHFSLDAEANHQITIDKQNQILSLGQSLSLGITNGLISPFVFVNNQISQAASALPSLMAANGAMLGTAIATPIQMGTLAANNIIAGVTGTLVSIPISLVSGGTAQVIGVVETGRHIYTSKVVPMSQRLRPNMTSLIRPLAIVGGANSVLGGIALGTIANGAKRIGQGVEYFGSSLLSAGQGIAGFGSGLSNWSYGVSQLNDVESVLELDELTTTTTTTASSTTIFNSQIELDDQENANQYTETSTSLNDSFLISTQNPLEIIEESNVLNDNSEMIDFTTTNTPILFS